MPLNLQVVVEGLGFPEGPVAMADGSVLFVDIKNQTLSRVQPNGALSVVAQLPGGPNGVAIGPDGAAYVCNNGGVYSWVPYAPGVTVPGPIPPTYQPGSVQRVDLATGAVTTIYSGLLTPDDIVFDATGGFWFTDSGLEKPDSIQKGALYYGHPDGRPLVQAAIIPMANGVGLSPDGKTIYVSDTIFGRLWAFDVTGPGQLGPAPMPGIMPGRIVQTLGNAPSPPGLQWLDSLKVEAGGNICVGTIFNGGISVFSPTGSVEQLAAPDMFTTNLCFGGVDMMDVWITASTTGKIYKTRWPRPGLKLAFNA